MNATTASASIEARNPATGELLATLATCPTEALADAVADVARVQPLWEQLRARDRAHYLRRTAQSIIDEFDDLARLLARESGRPLAEVGALELVPAIDTLRWLAAAGAELLGEERLHLPRSLHPLKRARVVLQPAGVIAIIGGGGAALAAPLCQVAAALLAGNGVVLKPSPKAALAGERIVGLFARAGLPDGLLSALQGGPAVGRALAGAAGVARVLFTGSATAGADVLRVCAEAGTPALIEAGGADPMLVLGDANAANAAAGALWAACAGAGQPHGTVKRVFVARELHDRFVADLVERAQTLVAGDPLDEGTQLGPLATRARRERLVAAVEEACAAGATLRCGAPTAPRGLPGAFHTPVVLCDVPARVQLARERVPGPVIAVTAVADSLAAVAHANSTGGAVAASIWTADRHHGMRVARELSAATVWINDHLPTPGVGRAPWGSAAGASMWRTLGTDGVRACVEPKLVAWDPPSSRPIWWHPYDRTTLRAVRALAELRSVRDSDRERALRSGSLALARTARRALLAARRH